MTYNEIKQELQKESLEGIKGILDKQYTNEIPVNDNEIVSNMQKYKQKGNYKENVNYNLNIEKMAVKNLQENITIVLVNAKIVNQNFDVIIKLDKANCTYSIFLEDYIDKYNYNENMAEKDININSDNIPENGYNKYIKIEVTDSYIASRLFSEYRMKMLNDTQEAYKLLDTEYSQKKYGNYEAFENYVNENRNKIKYASISEYQVTTHEEMKQYVCVDNNGKYYIFREQGVAQYHVILDTYTVDLPEFIEKYENNNDMVKVGINIQKIFDAINEGDYRYIYNKLDDTFKKANFTNEQAFAEYVNKTFANKKLKHEEYKKNGNLYMFDISITDDSENIAKKTVIMKLLEGTDFVMSFNVN